jgi:hypothetical protein
MTPITTQTTEQLNITQVIPIDPKGPSAETIQPSTSKER